MSLVENRLKRGDASDGGTPAGPLGRDIVRADGPLKVRGAATYALEYQLEGVLHCVIIQSTHGAGRVVAVDRTAAEASPGVRLVLDAGNSPKLRAQADFFGNMPPGDDYTPFSTDIGFNGELVAAVVADTLEEAQAAARLVRVEVAPAPVVATQDDPRAGRGNAVPMDKDWGDPDGALAEAPVVDRGDLRDAAGIQRPDRAARPDRALGG